MVRRSPVLVLCFGALACGNKNTPTQLPPLGEVVVSVDTDAPVPGFVGRLRIDVFDQAGRWLDSRDIARANAADWPASFSLYTLDESSPRTLLLRARAYLEGRTRGYHGERFAERRPYVEPKVATTLPELCQAPPPLVLGQELTLRRGPITITNWIPEPRPATAPAGWTPQCGKPLGGGAVAARLDIAEAGDYRLETTNVRPVATMGGDVTLFIRKNCSDPQSQIVCADDNTPGKSTTSDVEYLARIATVHLDPGSYTVMAGGYVATPAEITLRATLAAKWDEATAGGDQPEVVKGKPRLLRNGVDVTPEGEPQPGVTIDRLALLKLVPGQKQLASIVLRTGCAGFMARLSALGSNADPVLAEAQTCIDEKNTSAKLTEEAVQPFSGRPATSLVGTFAVGQACPPPSDQASASCIPSGTFVFGSLEGATPLPSSSAPERFAVMDRFWLDKTEVTVGRWRAALAQGFKSPDATPVDNSNPMVTSSEMTTRTFTKASKQNFLGRCSFSASPALTTERADYPLNCVSWAAARAFCQFEHGDLPTEAQWAYTATKAGRPFQTRFPWGDQTAAPGCDQAVFARWDSAATGVASGAICASMGFGVSRVTDMAAQADKTELKVLGLGGNLDEWALDGFEALDSACWIGASLRNPACMEENAPERPVLGGSWREPAPVLAGWNRNFVGPPGFIDFTGDGGANEQAVGYDETGFRCAYAEAPK